jgi:hypothetical protein
MATKVAVHALVVCVLAFTMYGASGYDCYPEKFLVLKECISTLKRGPMYKPPTDRCLRAVQLSDVDMTCICAILTDSDQKVIDPKKVIHFARQCGKPVPVGKKCGSK